MLQLTSCSLLDILQEYSLFSSRFSFKTSCSSVWSNEVRLVVDIRINSRELTLDCIFNENERQRTLVELAKCFDVNVCSHI